MAAQIINSTVEAGLIKLDERVGTSRKAKSYLLGRLRDNNDWLVVSQFTVVEAGHQRRVDVVVFVNGLPLSLIELKNPGDENATLWAALTQLQTYRQQIPSLFVYNEALVVSDGLQARIGSLTANREWFKPWRTIDGDDVAPSTMLELEVLIKGLFDKRRHLEFLRNFVAFEEDPHSDTLIKILAGYHQFHAVQQTVDATVLATGPSGDRRCGVVWHTQGSGKSLSMMFYAGEIILNPAMENPTIVDQAKRIRDDVSFFQHVRSALAKSDPGGKNGRTA